MSDFTSSDSLRILTGEITSTTPPPVTPGLPPPPPTTPATGPVILDHELKIADFVRVYMLGNGPSGRVIEQYAGQTGYHIRTIPASRFRNPVAIAAGAGYLAVVDRYGGGDLIRITDQYAGAGAAGFNSETGLGLSSINWGNLPDLQQIPTGGIVSGLQILPRGILVGCLGMGNGVPTFIKWDIDGSYSLYRGIFTLPAPFDTLGDATGRPAAVDPTQTDVGHEFFATIRNDTSGPCVVKVDLVKETVTGLQGLPAGIPYGVNNASGIVSVQMGDSSGIIAVYRFQRIDDTGYFASINSDSAVPAPTDEAITETFTTLDAPGVRQETYYNVAAKLNAGFEGAMSSREETVPDPAVALGGRPLTGDTTGSLNSGRTAAQTRYLTTFYTTPYEINASVIQNPTGSGLPAVLDHDSVNNTIAEMLHTSASDGSIDTTKPAVRLIHATHYDYLSDGGFVYGCVTQTGSTQTVQPNTSGLSPISVAVDKASEPGSLKELPDLKVALIDTATGLPLYVGTKSLGFNWYGGNSAGVKLTANAQLGTKKTQCSTVQDTNIDTTCDGVSYQYGPAGDVTAIGEDTHEPALFATPADYRLPWGLYIPRVTLGGSVTVQPYDSRSVLTKDDSGAYLPWWNSDSARQFPAIAVVQNSSMMVPKRSNNTLDPIFQTSCASGFFGLNWQKQAVHGFDQQNNPTINYSTPSSILNYPVGPLDLTPAADPTTPETGLIPTGDARQSMLSVETLPGSYPTLRRGVMFDTDIRSWVAVEIELDRVVGVTDGVASWIQPSALENGLGIRVGSASSLGLSDEDARVLKITPGYAYDYGSFTGNFGNSQGQGATGVWHIDIFANGVPISSIAKQVVLPEEIEYMAPSEAQDLLLGTFNIQGSGAEGSAHLGLVYRSSTLITNVTIRARLLNYAYDVFRVGWFTINHLQPDAMGGLSFCPGADPGFNAGNNCEAISCGNVACASQVTFGGKLFSSDPTVPLAINTLWEGTVTYQIPASNNPYAERGTAVGTLFSPYMKFDLNGAMSGWNINIRNG